MIKYFCDKCGVELNDKTLFMNNPGMPGCLSPGCISKEYKLYSGKSIKNVSLCAKCRYELESMRRGFDREFIESIGKVSE